MPTQPTVVAFDVIQTLFSIDPLRERFEAVDLPADAVELWFTRTLRDGMTLAASDTYRPFKEVAGAALEVLMAERGQSPKRSAVEHVLGAFKELPAQPDVEPAFARLRDRGVRIMTVSNGSRQATQTLLERADLSHYVAHVLSIDDVKCWKPRREVYHYTAEVAGVDALPDVALVAAHAWDVHGAKRAGLRTGWVRRGPSGFPASMDPPDAEGETLLKTCDALLG